MQVTFNIHIDDRLVSFFKRFFSKKRNIILVAMTVLLSSAALYAATMDWENLQAGDPVSASDLNTRFNSIRDSVNENSTSITQNNTFESISSILNSGLDIHNNDETYSSGHANLPSGLQIRWGTVYNDTDSAKTYSFETEFSHMCHICIGNVSRANIRDNRPIISWDKTGFTVNRDGDLSAWTTISYIAIGY